MNSADRLGSPDILLCRLQHPQQIRLQQVASLLHPTILRLHKGPINITATAADANGTVTRVEFFDGTTKLGEDTSSPYSFNWTNAAAGTHTLTIRVTDNENATATSTAVTITVTANASPTVSITAPANNAQVAAGIPFPLQQQQPTLTALLPKSNSSTELLSSGKTLAALTLLPGPMRLQVPTS